MIELSNYTLEAVGEDKDFNLYRGTSKNDKSQILVLSPAAEYPPTETLERLEHEYSLREELDLAWAARPIETARYRDSTVLVLDDPGGCLSINCSASHWTHQDTRDSPCKADRPD